MSANIPGLMITQAKGAEIKAAAPGTVNATMRAIGTDPVDNSYRWLSGEADPAFGGAIRDMWNPNCYGDPAKVTDAEYHCTVDDSGGVHTNSGVVNHTFALMVDGGDLQQRHRAGHRARQGGQPVLAGADRAPRPDLRLRGSGRQPGGLVHRADRGAHQRDGHHPRRRPDTGGR